jgi:hypothetical protein
MNEFLPTLGSKKPSKDPNPSSQPQSIKITYREAQIHKDSFKGHYNDSPQYIDRAPNMTWEDLPGCKIHTIRISRNKVPESAMCSHVKDLGCCDTGRCYYEHVTDNHPDVVTAAVKWKKRCKLADCCYDPRWWGGERKGWIETKWDKKGNVVGLLVCIEGCKDTSN